MMKSCSDILVLIFKNPGVPYLNSKGYGANTGSRVKIIYLVSLISHLASCNIRHAEEATIIKTMASLEMLSQDMDSLKSVNDSIWNQVSKAIENTVPADLPAAEKRNLMAVKNAELIQMFEIYDSFAEPLKRQVMDAGKSDQEIAHEMRDIMTKVDLLNKILTQNLSSLKKKDPEAADRLRLNINREKERITPR